MNYFPFSYNLLSLSGAEARVAQCNSQTYVNRSLERVFFLPGRPGEPPVSTAAGPGGRGHPAARRQSQEEEKGGPVAQENPVGLAPSFLVDRKRGKSSRRPVPGDVDVPVAVVGAAEDQLGKWRMSEISRAAVGPSNYYRTTSHDGSADQPDLSQRHKSPSADIFLGRRPAAGRKRRQRCLKRSRGRGGTTRFSFDRDSRVRRPADARPRVDLYKTVGPAGHSNQCAGQRVASARALTSSRCSFR